MRSSEDCPGGQETLFKICMRSLERILSVLLSNFAVLPGSPVRAAVTAPVTKKVIITRAGIKVPGEIKPFCTSTPVENRFNPES